MAKVEHRAAPCAPSGDVLRCFDSAAYKAAWRTDYKSMFPYGKSTAQTCCPSVSMTRTCFMRCLLLASLCLSVAIFQADARSRGTQPSRATPAASSPRKKSNRFSKHQWTTRRAASVPMEPSGFRSVSTPRRSLVNQSISILSKPIQTTRVNAVQKISGKKSLIHMRMKNPKRIAATRKSKALLQKR